MIYCDSKCFSYSDLFLNTSQKNSQKTNLLFSLVSLSFLFAIIALYPSKALASDFRIDVSQEGISGYADNAPLKDILSDISSKTGCNIYLNEKLSNAKTSFYIANKISNEKAIKLIIQPNSNIMVFGLNEKKEHYISDIKVYPKGVKTGKYMSLHDNARVASYGSSNNSSSYVVNSYRQSSGVDSNDVGRSLPERYKSKIYNVEKSAFGTPVLKKNKSEKGPGNSLNSSNMKKAYAKYRAEKKSYENRVSSSERRMGYLAAQKQRQQYLAKRQQAYQKRALQNSK